MNGSDTTSILAEYANDPNVPMEQIADEMGEPYWKLAAQLNPNHRYNFPVQKLVSLINSTQNYKILDHIERRVGRVAIKMPEKDCRVDCHGLAQLAKESGEAISKISNAILDGEITKDEAQECIDELMDLIDVAWGQVRTLQKIK